MPDKRGPERDFGIGTDKQARVISIMARIHKPHCEGNEDDDDRADSRPKCRVQKFRSICESSVSQSVSQTGQLQNEIASNRENDLKVE